MGLQTACAREGFRLVRDESNYLCIRFEPEPAHLRENQSAIRALQFLVTQGVAFARDYKHTYDPASSFDYLREVGLIAGSVLTCSFDGKHWHFERDE
jgi:hypothetical protein